ncbi:MAG: hypothetical protein WCH43_05310 [Verrucomicrobiota bacterium]
MKNRSYLISGLVVAAIIVGVWWFFSGSQKPPSEDPTITTNTGSKPAAVAHPQGTASPNSAANPSAIAKPTVLAQLKSKADLMLEVIQAENRTPLDFFGKVLDQYGHPVSGAKVKGGILLNEGLDRSRDEDHYTETDNQGLFSFTGIHGVGIGFQFTKEGYHYNLRLPSARPKDYTPDPSNPMVFTMWKLKGAESMTFARIHTYIPCDGSATSFNLLTGKKATDGGDMVVKLTRNPVNIDRSKPFDWTITFEVANGGLAEDTDAYSNEAPTEGYQSSVTINMPANQPNWTSSLSRLFYFKSRGGQNYGRMTISITADFQPPPTSFNAEIYANPASSRNLEYDPSKRADAQ